jgi:NitT/TauT family transport system permease protein
MTQSATAAQLEGQGVRSSKPFRLRDHPRLITVCSVVVTIGIWEWYGRGVDPLFFSYPTAILAAVPPMVASGELQRAALTSASALIIGFVLAVVLGVTLGLLMGRYWIIDRLFDAQVSALYSTPTVALIPLLILWFGLGINSKVAIVFLAAFFPILVNTHGGVRSVSRHLVEIARAERATEPQIFTKIIIPAALPFIMTGIRLSVGRAIVGMVVAEMFTAISGLGGAIVQYGNQFKTDKLLVVVILLALLGVFLTEFARAFERRLAPWKETERAD